jgi:hypothetical protein
MKTTVEVSDDLYRRAKSEAALRGRKLKDLVEGGLRSYSKLPASLSAALDDRGAQQCVLHREGRQWAGARLFLFRGQARSALGGCPL